MRAARDPNLKAAVWPFAPHCSEEERQGELAKELHWQEWGQLRVYTIGTFSTVGE
jgi:hypothetical protein